jgi:hypothetical protein
MLILVNNIWFYLNRKIYIVIIIIIIMALTQIDFDKDEEEIIEKVSKKHNLNKPKSVKKIVSEYKEDE